MSPTVKFLSRLRFLICLIAISALIYFAAYIWFFIPDSQAVFNWRPDHVLAVNDGLETDFQSGDIILSIDGQAPTRGRVYYPDTDSDTFNFEVERDGQIINLSIKTTRYNYIWPILFGLTTVLAGAGILLFSRNLNHNHLVVGSIFVFNGLTIGSVIPSVEGVPGAWIFGHVLIHFSLFFNSILGFYPRVEALNRTIKKIYYFISCSSLNFSTFLYKAGKLHILKSIFLIL